MCGSDRGRGHLRLLLAAAALALAGCGGDAPSPAAGSGSGSAAHAAATRPVAGAATGQAAPPAAQQPAGGGGVTGQRELAHPEDLQMLLLAYRLEGRAPPIADWAAAQPAVRSANEFERADVLREEQSRLQAVYDGTADVGLLRMNVRASFGEYEGGRGGWYLSAFTPGSVFTFSARPAGGRAEIVSLRIDNPGELNFWSLDPAAARQVLEANAGQRNVTLDSRLRITGVSRRSGGPVLSATLLGYTVISTRYRQPAVLGELRFDDGTGG